MLTPTQIQVLKKLDEGVRLCVGVGANPTAWLTKYNPYFFKPIRISTFCALRDRKMIKKSDKAYGLVDYYTISAVGREAVKEK